MILYTFLQERFQFIQAVKSRTALDWFSDSDMGHKPFNTAELTFSLLSDHCVT